MDTRNWRKSADDLYNELQREKRRSERFEDALEFYAKAQRSELHEDGGNLARETLKN